MICVRLMGLVLLMVFGLLGQCLNLVVVVLGCRVQFLGLFATTVGVLRLNRSAKTRLR